MEFLKYLWLLLQDQRGFVGDDAADDEPDDDKGDDDSSVSDDSDKDDDKTIVIEPDDDKDKEKDKKKDDKEDTYLEHISELEEKVQTLEADKTNLNTALHQARQSKKVPAKPADKLSEAELKQILADNPDDPDVQFNVLKYLSEQVAEGTSSKAISAAGVATKKKSMDDFLNERYPDIIDSSSPTRIEVEKTKRDLGLEEHPYGDYFAVATRVLEDLPELLEDAYKDGKEGKLKSDAEKNRTDKIKDSQLGSSKKGVGSDTGLTAEQSETAKQMGLEGNALKTYKKLIGKKVNAVSVEGK